MDRYYVGLREDGRLEMFVHDLKGEPTTEETGYEQVFGPFDTKDEARQFIEEY